MKIKGIKRGKTIELLEQINHIPDGTEIIVDVVILPNKPNKISETTQPLNEEERLSKLNQLFGVWQDQTELVEIFAEIDEERHAYRGRTIDSIETQDKQ